jgi:dTMP kinase
MHERIFGSRAFFRLWIAQVVASLGDWLGFLAIVVLAQRIGGGAPGAAVGLVMAARIIPGFFFAAGAGVLVDRMDRKQVMVLANVARAGVVCTLPFVDSLIALVLASLLLELATLMLAPAQAAAVPSLVPQKQLATANSLSLAAAYGTFPVASGLFALLAALAAWLGGFSALEGLGVSQESLAFYANALTYLFSALVISTLPISKDHLRHREDDDRRIDFVDVFREIKEGWHFIFINPVVRTVNVGLATGLIGGGMLVPLGPVFAASVLGAGTAGFGVFTFALGLGVAVGVVGISIFQRRLPKARLFAASVIGTGVTLAIATSMSNLLTAAGLVSIMGIFAGAVYVLGFTLLHENVDDELRGRVFAGLYTLVRLCVLIAFAVGGPISDLLDGLSSALFDRRLEIGVTSIAIPGVRLTLWLASAIVIGAGVLAVLSLRAGAERPPRTVTERIDLSGRTRSGDSAPPGTEEAAGEVGRSDGVDAAIERERRALGEQGL